MHRHFRAVLEQGEKAVEEQYRAYQRERIDLFLTRVKEDFKLDSFTPRIFEGYIRYDLAAEASSSASKMFYYDENIYEAFHQSVEDKVQYVIKIGRQPSMQFLGTLCPDSLWRIPERHSGAMEQVLCPSFAVWW